MTLTESLALSIAARRWGYAGVIKGGRTIGYHAYVKPPPSVFRALDVSPEARLPCIRCRRRAEDWLHVHKPKRRKNAKLTD